MKNIEEALKKIAEAFIEEKLRQEFRRPAQANNRRLSSVGLETERALRETLNKEFKKFRTFPPKIPLLLTEDDFKKTAPINSNTPLDISSTWGQCDLYYENSKVQIMGEVKTTTSAKHNICDLINKNLTAYRELKAAPLAIVLYPDTKAKKLRGHHTGIIEGLRDHGIISEEEYKKLGKCFFILTNIRSSGELEKRINAIDIKSATDIKQIIKSGELLKTGDLNYEEWKRLLKHVRNIIK